MIFEPMALRNQLDISVQVSKPFSEYPNVVYAPHTYTDSFTIDKNISYNVSLESAVREGFKMHAGTRGYRRV
jgi:hypothetical protein